MSGAPVKSSGRFWPWFVVGLLGINVCVVLVTVYLATHDRGFAVVPDYYQKAIHWDDEVARRNAQERLGWTAAVHPGVELDGRRCVEIDLSDREGRPLAGARVGLTMFHNAAPGEAVEASLKELSPGRYAAPAALARDGLWTFRVRAAKGTDEALYSLEERVIVP